MKKSIKIILLLFFQNLIIIQASYPNIDSLKQEFLAQTGSEQLKTGLLISSLLVDSPFEMLNFTLKLMNTADYLSPNTFLQAEIARSVADAYWYLDSISQSNDFLHKAIQIAESLNQIDSLFVGSVYNDIGFNDKDMGKRIEAREHFNQAIKYLEGNDYYELADAKSNLASLNLSEGKYQEAISMHLEVYQLDLKTGMKDRQSISLNKIGNIYIDWGKYERGLEYFFQSLSLLDTTKYSRLLGISYNDIGIAYHLLERNDEAIQWLEKARRNDEACGTSLHLSNCYTNLGKVYMSVEDYDQSEKHLNKAKDYYSKTKLYAQSAKVYTSLGQLYVKKGLNKKAEIYLLKSEEFAEKGGGLPEKSICYDKLYEFYKNIGQYKKALHYFELHTSAEDSIFNLKVSEQVEDMEAQYQSKQKEAEIIRLEKENNLKIKEIAFKNKQRNFALTGASILIIVLFTLAFLFTTVKSQKNKLENQNKELKRLNKTLNRLFAIISHDLRNATSAYQSSAKIIDYHLGKGQPEKLLPLSGEISSNAKNLSSMLENLLQWSTLQLKGADIQKTILNVKTEIERTTNLLNIMAKDKGNEIKVDIGNDVMVWCDRESFNLIIRNLLGNALKFTEKGCITFESEAKNNFTIIRISDTGCGIPDHLIKKIFIIGSKKIRMGSSGEKGTGLGLLMVAEHISKNNGTIKVESEEGRGTTFIVSLPSK